MLSMQPKRQQMQRHPQQKQQLRQRRQHQQQLPPQRRQLPTRRKNPLSELLPKRLRPQNVRLMQQQKQSECLT
jgi:hypothetical protein